MNTRNNWADIDDAGYWIKPEKDDASNKTAVTDEDTKPEPKPALVKLSEGQFIAPSMGYEYNKRFKVKVKVDFLDDSARNMKKVNFSLYSIYMNKTESLSHNVDGYETNGYAEADMTLYYPPSYDEDKDTNVKYFFKSAHERGDKVLDSEKLDMPQETHFVELKKDDYDVNGAEKYNKPQSGETYKIKGVVKTLQGNLIAMGFLDKGTDDGYFGDGTDAAVKEFQDYAIKPERMKRKEGKTEKAEKVLDQQASDGIVGKKTADEIDLWLRKDWVKPVPIYRKGEYDDKGVSNGKGKRGTDDHHTGTPISDAQTNLQAVGVYQGFSIDGWFDMYMYDAVKKFQETAKTGNFLIDGKETYVGEKLADFLDGRLCPKTQAFIKMVLDKKGKVAEAILSDSVGQKGKNIPADVKLVKDKLKELGYPINSNDDKCDEETIKAIKLFQIAYYKIETIEDTSNPKMVNLPDGLISKGKTTESNLFSNSAKKYAPPVKGNEKPISDDCKEKINSSTGTDKIKWDAITKVWSNISYYLPPGSSMTSGYRSADDQRTILYNFYNVKYKDKIIKKYSNKDWQTYHDLQGKNDANAEAKILAMVRACGQKIAAPGSSPHQQGIAIDIGGTGDAKQCQALLWCHIIQPGQSVVTKILPEVNGCVHFEFKV